MEVFLIFLIALACIAVYMLLALAPSVARFMEAREASAEKAPLVQFSLRRLMAAIALIAIGIALGLGVLRNPFNIAAWVTSGAAIGGGLALPVRKPIVGVLCGAFIQFCCGLSILISHMD